MSSFDDAQYAAVLDAINTGEIDQAKLAQNTSASAAVRRFATHMLNDHREIANKTKTLLTRMHVSSSETSASTQLKSDEQTQLSTLESDTGHDFDRAYVDDQVQNHNEALELIDRMLPNLKSSQNVRAKRPRHQA